MKNAAPDDPTRPRRESRLRAGVAPGRSEPPARVLGAPRRPATVPGKILSSVLLAGEAVVSSVAGQPRPDCGSSGPTPPLETAVVVDPWLAIVRQRDHAPLPLAAGDDRQTIPPSASLYRDTAIADMPGDDGVHELSADLPEDTRLATQAIWSSTSPTTRHGKNACRHGRATGERSSTRPRAGVAAGHAKRCGWPATLICETASGTRT